LDSVKYTPKDNGVLVSGKIIEKDAPKGLVTPVPVYASLSGKNLLLGRVFVEDSETTFHLIAPAGTRRVVVDPEQTLLTRVH
jgi:hypothetical protein